MALSEEKRDIDIISAVLDGDTEEFAVLIRRYQDKILGFCLSMLSENEAARDAAQEIFIKAYKGLADFRGDSAFSTWLYRIAFNHCRTLQQRTASARTESLDAMSAPAREEAERRIPRPLDTSDDDLSKLAAQAVDSLPAGYRAAISLRLQGADYQTIAATLGVSVDSVKARLRRARIILRDRLRHFLSGSASKQKEPLK